MKRLIILSLVLALAVLTFAGQPSQYAKGSIDRAIAQGWYQGTDKGFFPNRYVKKGAVVGLIDNNNLKVVGPTIMQARAMMDYAYSELNGEIKALKAREGKLVKRIRQLEDLNNIQDKLFWYSVDGAIVKNDALDLLEVKVGLDLDILGADVKPYVGWVRNTVYRNDNQMVGVKVNGTF